VRVGKQTKGKRAPSNYEKRCIDAKRKVERKIRERNLRKRQAKSVYVCDNKQTKKKKRVREKKIQKKGAREIKYSRGMRGKRGEMR